MLDELNGGVEGLRIGFDTQYASGIGDPGLVASIEEALEQLAGLGAQIVDVKMPEFTDRVVQGWITICALEAHAAHKTNYPSRADEYGAFFGEFLAVGAEVTDAEYAEASRLRAEFSERFRAVFSTVDAIASPSGRVPFAISSELLYGGRAGINEAYQWPDQFTLPAN